MKSHRAQALALLAVIALVVALPAADKKKPAKEAKPRVVKLRDITLSVPADWKQEKPRSNLRAGQFSLPPVKGDKDAAELAIFFFGGTGGGADANIRRWIGQFQAEGRKMKVLSGESSQGPYLLLDLTGTYNHINEVTTIGAHLDNRQENAAKTVRADALLEFRMNYTNLVTRSFATSHRAQDSPLDFDHIRRMCTRLKSYMINPEAGRQGNVAVHADPAYWQPGESPANVARFMSSLVTSGVPMLSTDLRTLEGEHRRIVKAWLAFFKEHQDLLLFGAQQILSANPHHSIFSLQRLDAALWGVYTAQFPGQLQVPATGIRQLWMLNGSEQERLFVRLAGLEGTRLAVQSLDRGLEQKETTHLLVEDGCAVLDLPLEAGGALELRLQN